MADFAFYKYKIVRKTMRQTNVRGTLSLRGFRKLRTGAIVATGVILLGLGFLAPTVSANEQDGVWVALSLIHI